MTMLRPAAGTSAALIVIGASIWVSWLFTETLWIIPASLAATGYLCLGVLTFIELEESTFGFGANHGPWKWLAEQQGILLLFALATLPLQVALFGAMVAVGGVVTWSFVFVAKWGKGPFAHATSR